MSSIPAGYPRVRQVNSFQELAAARFADGVNAFCWSRMLPGDFCEVMRGLGSAEAQENGGGVVTLERARLRGLKLGAAGRTAVDAMLDDLRLVEEQGRDPVLNCIHGYPRDEEPGPVTTDVYSFHADSAPVEADTWLCTYHGPPSEGLCNDEARRRVDIAGTRGELLRIHGGADDEVFREFLRENAYDLHYLPVPGARPFSFGVGNLWRIAVDWPGSPVPPCIHRAPATRPGDPARLLLIA